MESRGSLTEPLWTKGPAIGALCRSPTVRRRRTMEESPQGSGRNPAGEGPAPHCGAHRRVFPPFRGTGLVGPVSHDGGSGFPRCRSPRPSLLAARIRAGATRGHPAKTPSDPRPETMQPPWPTSIGRGLWRTGPYRAIELLGLSPRGAGPKESGTYRCCGPLIPGSRLPSELRRRHGGNRPTVTAQRRAWATAAPRTEAGGAAPRGFDFTPRGNTGAGSELSASHSCSDPIDQDLHGEREERVGGIGLPGVFLEPGQMGQVPSWPVRLEP